MWLVFALIFLLVGFFSGDITSFVVCAIFAVAHNIEYLAIQVKNLKQ